MGHGTKPRRCDQPDDSARSRARRRAAGALWVLVLLTGGVDFGGLRNGPAQGGFVAVGVAADPVPAPERFTVIRAGRIITNTGPDIVDGVVIFSGGKITNVGHGIEYPLSAKIIDARDGAVMPGLIDPSTRFGLPNYGRNDIHGNWSVADEYFPRADLYDEILDAGYTTLALIPAGGGIPGRALVVRTGGPADARVLSSPAYLRVTADKKTFRAALERAQQEIEKVDKARQEFDKKQEQEKKAQEQKPPPATQPSQPASQPAPAPATQPAFQPPPIDPAVQVLVDLIQKKPDILALIELNSASDFVQMDEVLQKYPVAHAFLARSPGIESDFDYVAEKMGEQKARVILLPLIQRLPNSAARQNLPRMFSEAGCEVSLGPANDSAREHQRALGRLAELVREGWSREQALKSVTLYPAQLLGLGGRLGTIEKGKDADLIVLDGDPLRPTTRVRSVLIGGEVVREVGREVNTSAREGKP